MDLIQLMGSPSGNRFELGSGGTGTASQTALTEAGKEFSIQLGTALDSGHDQEVDPSGLIAQMVALDLNLGQLPVQPVGETVFQAPAPLDEWALTGTGKADVARADARNELWPANGPTATSDFGNPKFEGMADVLQDPTGSRPNPFGSRPGSTGLNPDPFGSRPNPFGSRPNPFGTRSPVGKLSFDTVTSVGQTAPIDEALPIDALFSHDVESAAKNVFGSKPAGSVDEAVDFIQQGVRRYFSGDSKPLPAVDPLTAYDPAPGMELGGIEFEPQCEFHPDLDANDPADGPPPVKKQDDSAAAEYAPSIQNAYDPAPAPQNAADVWNPKADLPKVGLGSPQVALPNEGYRGTGQGRREDSNGLFKPGTSRISNFRFDPSAQLNSASGQVGPAKPVPVSDIQIQAIHNNASQFATSQIAMTAADVIGSDNTIARLRGEKPKGGAASHAETILGSAPTDETTPFGSRIAVMEDGNQVKLSKKASAWVDGQAVDKILDKADSDSDSGVLEPVIDGSEQPLQAHQPLQRLLSATPDAPQVDADAAVRHARDEITRTVLDLVAARQPQSVKIHLNPVDLGTIDISVKGGPGRVDIDLRASDDAVRQSLAQHRADLVGSIEGKGTSVGSMNVGSQSQTFDHNQGQNGHAPTRDDFRNAATLGQFSTTAESQPLRQPSYQAVATGRVDLAA